MGAVNEWALEIDPGRPRSAYGPGRRRAVGGSRTCRLVLQWQEWEALVKASSKDLPDYDKELKKLWEIVFPPPPSVHPPTPPQPAGAANRKRCGEKVLPASTDLLGLSSIRLCCAARLVACRRNKTTQKKCGDLIVCLFDSLLWFEGFTRRGGSARSRAVRRQEDAR